VLFSSRDCSGQLPDDSQLPFGAAIQLERNEVIALVNLLGRFSHSLSEHHRLMGLLRARKGGGGGAADMGAASVV
jgi:ERO1-like protein alpha